MISAMGTACQWEGHDGHKGGWREETTAKSRFLCAPQLPFILCKTASVASTNMILLQPTNPLTTFIFCYTLFLKNLAVQAMRPITVKQDYSNGQNLKTTGIKSPLFLPSGKAVLLIYLRLWKLAGMKYVSAGKRICVLPSSRCHPSTAVVALK